MKMKIVFFSLLFASSVMCQSIEELKQDQKECYKALKKSRKNMVACMALLQSNLDLQSHENKLIEETVSTFLCQLEEYKNLSRKIFFTQLNSPTAKLKTQQKVT